MNKLCLIVDVYLTDGTGHIGELEDLLGSRFGRVQMLLRRLPTQNWDSQSDRKLNVIN